MAARNVLQGSYGNVCQAAAYPIPQHAAFELREHSTDAGMKKGEASPLGEVLASTRDHASHSEYLPIISCRCSPYMQDMGINGC